MDEFFCRVGEGVKERGAQQENSCTKHAVTNRLPVTATHGRVKQASALEFFLTTSSVAANENRLGFEDHRVATKCFS